MTFQISVGFRLDLDEGYDPPQGTSYVSGSSIFKETKEGGEMKGFWQVTDVLDNEVPSTISLSFKCPDGISVSGETVIPPGFLYANVRVKRREGSQVGGVPARVERATRARSLPPSIPSCRHHSRCLFPVGSSSRSGLPGCLVRIRGGGCAPPSHGLNHSSALHIQERDSFLLFSHVSHLSPALNCRVFGCTTGG